MTKGPCREGAMDSQVQLHTLEANPCSSNPPSPQQPPPDAHLRQTQQACEERAHVVKEPCREGAMDGLVQLHTLEVNPRSVTPPWRPKPTEAGPRRLRQGAQRQAHPMSCLTLQFRCHTSRVKVRLMPRPALGVTPHHWEHLA